MSKHILGFFAPWLIYAGLLILHLVVPARKVDGYVTNPETGAPLRYRLNGLPVLLLSVGIWAVLGALDILRLDWLYINRWAALAGAVALGLICSLVIVIGAPRNRKTFLADFFLGRRVNPQFISGRVDAKMFLYLAGATLLALNLLSFAAGHILRFPNQDPVPVLLYTALFFWFLIDYMTFERVHLYTYDLFAERVGFKLTFGCLAFYPYFYAVGLWVAAELPPAPTGLLFKIIAAALFFLGWTFARGANMQKFTFKIDPQKPFLGLWKPETVSDGTHALLCNGFWGVSRHVNYLGEILMATGLTLALGYPGYILPWLYPVYYILLLFTRERDDNRRCSAKYGALWDEYTSKVRYRILPGIY